MYNDVGDMLDAWMLLFTKVCDRQAPTKRHCVRHQKQPDWLSEDIVTAIHTRNEHKSHSQVEPVQALAKLSCQHGADIQGLILQTRN